MIRISAILFGLMTLLMGIIYPLFMTAVGHLMPHESGGSLIKVNDVVVGSKLIGQNFASDRYFNSRPSAANYDAAKSAGSNLSPTSKKLFDQVAERTDAYRIQNGLKSKDHIPGDAIHASGSGLDPHISLSNALLQAPRIATARNLELNRVIEIIKENTEGPTLGILGEKRVHVLHLNLHLDGRPQHEPL